MKNCENCIHYKICCLWSTTDLKEDEAYKYCYGSFKDATDVVPKSEVRREILDEIKNLLTPIVYLGVDGIYHIKRPYANNIHLFVDNFLNLYEKYTEDKK